MEGLKMWKPLATGVVWVLVTIGSAEARPFTARDLALQERVSDPHVSPDGRFVAYNVRSTDWDGNRGVNALWMLDRESRGGPPRLIRDQEKSATQPQWSADGRWLYFLSSRSGSSQVWRVSPVDAESRQMTGLPLDVGFYRVAPGERQLVLAVIGNPGCRTLACSKAKDDGKAKQKPTGTLYDSREVSTGCCSTAARRPAGSIRPRQHRTAIRLFQTTGYGLRICRSGAQHSLHLVPAS
jgi:hypothetical protein